MKNQFLMLLSFALLSCTSTPDFKTISCSSSEISYQVFKPCRQMIYSAKFWDAEYNLISDEKIWMMTTGKPWEVQPDRQMELLIQYTSDEDELKVLDSHQVNQTLNVNWIKETTTGIVETDRNIWMHPFRANQYNFTEVAPFPSVNLPLTVSKQWSGKLNIGEGWGDWGNSEVSRQYQVQEIESIDTEIGPLDAWKIHSFAEAPFGISTHNFWFHEELGFVKMIINSYAGQTLEFELIEVIDG